MEGFRWDIEAAPELLVKYGFVKRYDVWEYDYIVDIDGFRNFDVIGVLILNLDGSIEAAGQVDEDLVEQLFRDKIIYEVR